MGTTFGRVSFRNSLESKREATYEPRLPSTRGRLEHLLLHSYTTSVFFLFSGILGSQNRAAGVRVGGRTEGDTTREDGKFEAAETIVSGKSARHSDTEITLLDFTKKPS